MERRDKLSAALTIATLGVLAWGAFAFAGNYPWAYTPLLVGMGVVGVAAMSAPRPGARVPRLVVYGAILVAVAILVQLMPLHHSTLRALSPGTDNFLQRYDVAYAQGVASGTDPQHPLSINPSRTLLALCFLAALTLTIVGTAQLLTTATAHVLVGGIALLGVLLTLDGLVQQATWNGKIYGFWKPLTVGSSPFGPFVNRNHFAGWSLMALPLVLGWFVAQVTASGRRMKPGVRNKLIWLSSPEASRTVLAAAAAIVIALGLVLTSSRSGILGLIVALVVAAAWIYRHADRNRARVLLIVYCFAVPAVVAAFAGLDVVTRRFVQPDATSFGDRVAIWQDAARMAHDFLPFGTGLNTFGYASPFYKSSFTGSAYVREAHNDYLQLAAEGGVVTCAAAAVALMLSAFETRRRLHADRGTSSYWIRVGAVVGIAGIAVQSCVDFSLQMPGNAALFAVLCGVAMHSPERWSRQS